MSKPRQAVVIIHGIGEQRPMGTLRGFVDSILPESSSNNEPKFWSKPDLMSESYELRRLRARATSNRPSTDFYEYYWADRMPGTTFGHVQQWFRHLLLRLPKDVPARIRPIWALSWVLVMLSAYFVAGGLESISGSWQKISELDVMSSVVYPVALTMLNIIVIGYIGDAARYLSPTPDNIARRHEIRARGISLVKKLHESNKYDRIIIVGHSLGSIIGYDILRYLWAEFNVEHGSPIDFRQEALKELEAAGNDLSPSPTEAEIDAFQVKQSQLWVEQRALGNPWLVTDFISLGSPLAYAPLLLASSQSEFAARKRERELPTCPPAGENGAYSYPLDPYEVKGGKRTMRVLHHGALFACTKWTNMYFPGDIIAGSLNKVFGTGIKDIRLHTGSFRRLSHSLFAHNWYWQETQAIRKLRKALGLDSTKRLMEISCDRSANLKPKVPV